MNGHHEKSRSTSNRKSEKANDDTTISMTSSIKLHYETKYDFKTSKSFSNFRELEDKDPKNIKSSFIETKSKFFLANESVKTHPFRSLIFSPETSLERLKSHLSLIQRGLLYSKACLKQPSPAYLKKKAINLKDQKRSFYN